MAKIALIAGIAALGALTGGLAAAGFGIFAGTFAGGSILGGIALGGSLGLTAGETIGGFLFQPHLNGPRLADQQISGSTPGSPIPWGYGGFRIAGQIIWASGIIETATNQSTSGGKGFGGPTTTVYTYTISFACAFCEGPASITRIWGDSKLIYDTTSKGAVSSDSLDTGLQHSNGSNITEAILPTIYPGSATQLPDPTIQAAEGINETPAFRNMCYLVYQDFPLADFGNRLPNIRAEVSTSTNLSYVKDTYPPNGIPDADGTTRIWAYCFVDPINRVAILLDVVGQVGARIDLATTDTEPVEEWQASTAYVVGDQVLDNTGNVETVKSISGDGKTGSSQPTWTVGGIGETTNDNHVTWINTGAGPNAILVTSQFKIASTIGSQTLATASAVGLPLGAGVDTRGYVWACYELQSGGFIFNKIDSTTFAAVNQVALTAPVTAVNFAQILGEDLIYAVTAPGFTGGSTLYQIKSNGTSVKATASVIPSTNAASVNAPLYPAIDPSTGIAYVVSRPNLAGNTSPYEWNVTVIDNRSGGITSHQFFGNSTTGAGDTCMFDPIDNSLIVFTVGGCMLKVDIATWAVLVTTAVLTHNSSSVPKWHLGMVPNSGIFYIPDASNTNLLYINHSTLAVESTIPQASWFATAWGGILDAQLDIATLSLVVTSATGGNYGLFPERLYLNRQEVASESLDQIVLDLCERSGMDSAQVDVTALASTNVLGYCVTRNTDAKSAMAPLLMAYFFGAVESDFVLKFVPRGGAIAMTIPEADMGLEAEGYELEETIAQEHDLPKTIDVLYADPALDYQPGKQSRRRNARVVTTKNKSTMELPLTLDGDTAAQIADIAIRVIWDERNQYAFKLSRSLYLQLDATDVIAFGYQGSSYVARIAKATIGQDRILELAAMSEDSHSYLSVQTGSASPGFPPQILNPAAGSALYLMDLPLLEDTDSASDGNTGYYFAMSSPATGWPGAVLQDSPDGSNYTQVGFSTTPIGYGPVGPATPAPPAPMGADVIDNTTQLVVRVFANGFSPSSTTLLNVLNGANALILGSEVIQYVNATLNADGSYTLSTLLRGRRGTEWACGIHTTGEVALFVPTGLHRNLVPLSQIGLPQFFRVVTIGQTPGNAGVQNVTLQGNDLKPLSPCSISGSRDGSNNLTIAWLRRTRIGGEQDWLDGVLDVPLSEASEAYSVDIIVSGIVVRTISGLTSPTASYPASEQTTDGITPGNPVTLNVYQISAAVGRGFPGAATV